MQATRGAALGPAADTPKPREGRPLRLLAGVAAAVLAADQISKIAVVGALQPGRPVEVLGSVLRLDLTRNSGAAFSVGTGSTWLFTVIAVVVVVVILRAAGVPGIAPRTGGQRLASRRWAVCLGLLLGGALGNLVDRLVRAPGPLRGHVVDWIELPHWPVFNVADAAITAGAVLAVLLSLLGVALSAGSTVPPEAT